MLEKSPETSQPVPNALSKITQVVTRSQVLGFSGQFTVPFFFSLFQKWILRKWKKVIQCSHQYCDSILNSNRFPLCSYTVSCAPPLEHCVIMIIKYLCFKMSFSPECEVQGGRDLIFHSLYSIAHTHPHMLPICVGTPHISVEVMNE